MINIKLKGCVNFYSQYSHNSQTVGVGVFTALLKQINTGCDALIIARERIDAVLARRALDTIQIR